jgi:hypothetical protein
VRLRPPSLVERILYPDGGGAARPQRFQTDRLQRRARVDGRDRAGTPSVDEDSVERLAAVGATNRNSVTLSNSPLKEGRLALWQADDG